MGESLTALQSTAEWVPAPGPLPQETDSLPEETRLLAGWLETAELISVIPADDRGWSLPRQGATSHAHSSGAVRLSNPV